MSTATRSMNVNPTLSAHRRSADRALERATAFVAARLSERLAAPARYALGTPGKRLRPVLCVVAYRAVSRIADHDDDVVHDVAAALEVIHTYSLLHDDLPCMDDDDLRRGRPTTHRVFGSAAATLAGAAMIPLAFAWLDAAAGRLALDEAERAALLTVLAEAAGGGGMVGGQILDLDAEARPIQLDELEDIHRRKTGALFEATLRLGGMAARADRATVEALAECGRALGLAFQITDDLLDETADSAVLGKTAGRDREREKATFPVLLGVAVARQRAAAASAAALAALDRVGIRDELLRELVRFAVERER